MRSFNPKGAAASFLFEEKMDTKFSLDEIEKTFVKFGKEKLVEGVVIAIRPDGLVFNLGGKADAFIPVGEVENFNDRKIGDRFSVVTIGGKNDEGMVLCSQIRAAKIELESQNARAIKLGGTFQVVISKVFESGALGGKMGDFEIFIPEDEVSSRNKNPRSFLNKKVEAIATSINLEEKRIVGSIKILDDKTRAANEEVFWRTNFINKVVDGTVKRFVPYGAFVDVGGVSCLLHISNISYSKINSPADVLEIGKTYKFRILQMDRDSKKVSLGYKQLHKK